MAKGRRTVVERDSASVEIEGLAEFILLMKKANPDLVVKVALANYAVGKEIVDDAKVKANSISKPGSARLAAKSLGASKSSKNAMVRGGGKRAPFFFGAEFGAKRFKQFAPWRGNSWVGFDTGVGYFLHPAIRESWPEAKETYLKTIDEVMRASFPE